MANKQTFVRYATVGKTSFKPLKFSTLFWVTLFVFTVVKTHTNPSDGISPKKHILK
jgi:hypothetical protein